MPLPQHIEYCGNCAHRAFENWRGWPERNAVPLLPRFNSELQYCGTCRKRWPLASERIAWSDYRETDDAGMPDYWILVICEAAIEDYLGGRDHFWGRPYYTEARCSRCDGPSIVSEMKYPNGTRQFSYNCRMCGVVPLETGG